MVTPIEQFISVAHSTESAQRTPYSREVHPLSYAAQNLLTTESVDTCIRAINSNFYKQDLSAMERDLTPHVASLPTTAGIVSWLSRASHYETTQFSRWYQARQQDFQLALRRDQGELQDYTMNGFHMLAKIGLSSYESTNNLRSVIQTKGRLVAMSSLQPNSSLGFYTGNAVMMSNAYANPMNFTGLGATVRKTILHEYAHAPSRFSLLVNEAAAEYMSIVAFLSLSGADPQPHKLRPSLRDERNPFYENERELVGLLMEKDGQPLSELVNAQLNGSISVTQEFESRLQATATRLTGSPDFLVRLFSRYRSLSTAQKSEHTFQALRELLSNVDPVGYPRDSTDEREPSGYFAEI